MSIKIIPSKLLFPATLACLIISALVGHAQPIVWTFNSATDVSGWQNGNQNVTVTSSFVAGDAPSGQNLSVGALLWSGIFNNPAGFNWGVLQLNFSPIDLSTYTDIQFDYKIVGGNDEYSTSGDFQPVILLNGVWDQTSAAFYLSASPSGWKHVDILLSTYSTKPGGNVNGILLSIWDGYYTNQQTLQVEFDNIEFTGGSSGSTNNVTPQFSGLANSTSVSYGASVSLSGTVSAGGSYPPAGTVITMTVNGNMQQTTINDSTGDFSINYSIVGIPVSATPYSVTYTSAAANGFNTATNTGTTLTINLLPVILSGYVNYTGTATVPAANLTVANLVTGDNLTLAGNVTVASINPGSEAITSFSGLTLGGTTATNYTLTGASGTVTITNATSAGTGHVIPRSFFGLHGLAYPANGVPAPSQPYGLFRTWDHWGNGNITWGGLEPSKGTFTWSAMDATVNAITNSNVAILHCFGAGPSWAGGTAPTNILDWDLFITNFVTRYHTKIKYLETWNEAMAGEGFYTGTTAMLVQMEHDLYTITKSIDPTVTVLTPDATGGKANMTTFYSQYFAAGGTNCDAIAFHGYCSEAFIPNQITYPEEIIGIVGNLKAAMNAYGQGSKPIFCTEGDWGSEGSGGNCPTTNDAVAFMARQYLLLWSLGVSSYAWYAWDYNGASWQTGQLWTYPTGPLNAAGIAYQQLYYWMVSAVMSQPATNQGSVYTCGFTRPGGYQALAVWDTNRASASSFMIPSGYVQYRDLAGNLNSISGSTVTVGIEPILLENMNEPTFSSLTSHTITYGKTNVMLTGTVSSYGIYPPSGTVITVSINGNAQTTTTSDATGDFSINYNTAGLLTNVYPVTYSCAAAGSFPGGTDTTTTLTVNPLSVVLSGISANGTQFIFSYPTIAGQTSQLQYMTNFSSGTWMPAGDPILGTGLPIWVTNSINSSMQMFFRLSITP